jgi:hypothetical protein
MIRFTYIIFLVIATNNLLAQSSDGKMLQRVLAANTIGKPITYIRHDTAYGKLEYRFMYIGRIKTVQHLTYKIVTRTLFSGISHHASNRIYVLDNRNKLLGFYRIVLVDELPIKIKGNYLFFHDSETKRTDSTYCGKELPQKIYGRPLESE